MGQDKKPVKATTTKRSAGGKESPGKVKSSRSLYDANGTAQRFPTDEEWENMSPITQWGFIAAMED